MENAGTNNSTLHLTAYCFEKLLDALHTKLESQHPGILKNSVSQVYGFGNFDESLPNLKTALQEVSGEFINGKYLYDKNRELISGKPLIKLNRPYKYLLFEYLGHSSIESFLESYIEVEEEKQKQLNVLNTSTNNQTHYYVSYYFGEYKEIVKAQVIVKDNWKSIEYKYIYHQNDGTINTFIYYGDVKKRADALHIQTRTFMDGKMVPSGENILYIGYGDPAKSKYILGVFSAFDINNRLIAVKCIYEKCVSEEEMNQRTTDRKIPGYIAQEIRNQRIENEIHIPNDKLEISANSPYYLTYEKITGDYTFTFESEGQQLSELKIRIDPDNYKISSLIPGVLIIKDNIELINNGSILKLNFNLSGLSSFLYLDIYVKTYSLIEQDKDANGKFSGVDFENRIVIGKVSIELQQ